MLTLERKKAVIEKYIELVRAELQGVNGVSKDNDKSLDPKEMRTGNAGDRGSASTAHFIKCTLLDTSKASFEALQGALEDAHSEKEKLKTKKMVEVWSLVTVEYSVGENSYEKKLFIVPVGGGYDLGNGICSISLRTPLALALLGRTPDVEIEGIINGQYLLGEITDLI
jgi:hypothetical protein